MELIPGIKFVDGVALLDNSAGIQDNSSGILLGNQVTLDRTNKTDLELSVELEEQKKAVIKKADFLLNQKPEDI
jgi:hypothetical protein